MTPLASSNSWDHEIAMQGIYRRWLDMMERGEEGGVMHPAERDRGSGPSVPRGPFSRCPALDRVARFVLRRRRFLGSVGHDVRRL